MFALLAAGCTAFKDNGPLTTYADCPFPIDWKCPTGSAPHIVSDVPRFDGNGFYNPKFKKCAWLQEQGAGLGEWEAWAGAAGQPPATRPGPAAIYKKQFH